MTHDAEAVVDAGPADERPAGPAVRARLGTDAAAALRYCVVVFVLVRIGLFLVGLLSVAVLPANGAAKVPGIATPAVTHSWSVMFTAWERWDALWYIRIATHGYAPDDGSAAFFPGYPLLVRDAAWLTGGHPLLGAYLVSSVALVVGLTLVYLLTEFEFDRDLARRTVVLMCLFPTSFFFFSPYSESLFLALSVGAIFAARRSSWMLATLLAVGATATRNMGVVVGLAIAVESLRQVIAAGSRGRALLLGLSRTAGVGAGSLLGIAAYLAWWGWHARSATVPFSAQGGWQRHFRLPWVSLWDGVHEGLRWIGIYSGGYQLVDLIVVGVALLGAVWVMIKTPIAYRVYTAVSLVAPLCLVFGARPFMSMPRFVLVLFPVFWAFAVFTRRFSAWNVVTTTSAAGLGMVSLLFVNWYWVY
jgi:hypothetical protein